MDDPVIIAVATIAFLFFVSVLGLFVWGLLTFVRHRWKLAKINIRRMEQLIQPDQYGRLPIPEKFLYDPVFAVKVLDTHNASFFSNVRSYHIANGTEQPALTDQQSATIDVKPTEALPSFWQLYQGRQLPQSGFLLGFALDDEQKPVVTSWSELCSSLVGGKSGMGKSTLIRSLLAQSALQGGRFLVIDPHYRAGERSLGASIQPLRKLLLADVAADNDQIVSALDLITAIGKQRLQGHDADRTPIVLVVDETSALLSRSATANALIDALGQITQETGKVGIYAICIGQDFNGHTFNTTVRNAFVSMFTMRARKETARIQSGSNDFGRKAETLRIGQCVWMNPSGDTIRIAVPNCTQDDLSRVSEMIQAIPALPLVNHSSPIGSTISSTISSGNAQPELDAKANSAINMFLQGASNNDIVAQLWGATSGDKKMKALQELNTILRTHMINLKGVNHGTQST